ncbi:ABC transporter permease [Acidicapsa ligni]|uniref:ABC transporter permease n=1 Tax=Acidicapsa ligni TaxID=542300 RepID=UPI0021E0DD98|nr:ABC transporter permease [Acidicapsa ligni]
MRALRRAWLRGWTFITRRSGDQRLREEVEQHLALETEANIRAGMTPAQALRTARMKFGPVEAIRESYHSEEGLPAMETILQNCIFAMRMMRKSPAFTAVAALTLALGIGATSAVFSLIQGVLLTPPPYDKPDQLVLVSAVRTDKQKMDSARGWAAQQWMDWGKDATSLQGVAGYGWTFNFLVRNDGSQSMQGMEVSKDYSRLMGLKTAAGRGFEDSDFAPGPVKAIVLGYEFWQRAFAGDPQIIGKTIRISRWDTPPTVIGIMEPGVRFLPSPGAAKEPNYDVNAPVDLWVPIYPDPKNLKDPGWNVVARLRDGVSLQKGQQELAVLTARGALSEKTFEGFQPQLQTVKDEMNQDGQRILLPLLGAAALVLLIACGNVAALLLVRGLQRQQEYAIRIAMGMGRLALVRLILTESLLLAILGGALGIGLAFGAVTLFKMIAIHAVPRLDSVHAGSAVLVWGLVAAVLAAFFAGIFPALRVLRLDPMEVLKSAGPKGTAGVGERRLLRAVAMLQTSLTLALLVGAGLLIRTMAKIAVVPSGYSTGQILTMSVTDVQNGSTWSSFHHHALERVAAIPGVQYAAFAWGVPLTGNNWPATIEIEGQPPAVKESDKTALPMRAVTPDYFKLMGMAQMNGREFRSTDDDKAPKVAIVNHAFADRFFPHDSAIGRKLWFDGRDKLGITIVGEISDGRTDDLTQKASSEVYLPLWQANAFSKHLVIRTTADPRAIVVAVERELRAVDPTAAIENVRTLEQIRDDSLASRTFAMRLLVGFAAVGSLLTLVGIYGVLSLSVVSRRKELAIRCAVGAQHSDLRKLILGEGFRVIAGGVLLGAALAVALSQVLKSFLYEVQPSDPATLIAVGLLFLAVGLLACWVPAWRAEKVDPLEALRCD